MTAPDRYAKPQSKPRRFNAVLTIRIAHAGVGRSGPDYNHKRDEGAYNKRTASVRHQGERRNERRPGACDAPVSRPAERAL